MKGRETKARPARAIGSFSPSDILSMLEEKYSSGSLSRVSFLGSSPSPNMWRGVVGEDTAGLRETEVAGAKAPTDATERRATRRAARREVWRIIFLAFLQSYSHHLFSRVL